MPSDPHRQTIYRFYPFGPMNIVHVTHRAWPVFGGSERHVQEIARRQVLDGHQVTILATDADSLDALWDRRGRRLSLETPAEHQGVRIRRLAVRHLPVGTLAFPALRRVAWLLSLLSAQLALPLATFGPWVPGLRQVLAQELADLLFAWNITLEGLTAAVAHEAHKRYVPWIAVPLLHLGRPRFYTMRHQVDLLRRASAVLTQTTFDRTFLLQRGLAPGRVCIAGPGVDPVEGAQADGQRFRQKLGIERSLVVTLGSLGYDKGTLHLISAMQKLWIRGLGAHLALLGSQEASVRRALARLPESQQAFCHSLGQVSEQDKWDALDAADVVALPSRTESFGIVFLEAWMRGKPVIGARAGGVMDVIHDGVNGRLVEFGDEDALAGALASLLDQPEQARAMGQRGRDQTLRDYTWDQQYRRVRAVIEQVFVERRS
jgi:glycosyltransferase involved in cell wall biosynthesis